MFELLDTWTSEFFAWLYVYSFYEPTTKTAHEDIRDQVQWTLARSNQTPEKHCLIFLLIIICASGAYIYSPACMQVHELRDSIYKKQLAGCDRLNHCPWLAFLIVPTSHGLPFLLIQLQPLQFSQCTATTLNLWVLVSQCLKSYWRCLLCTSWERVL